MLISFVTRSIKNNSEISLELFVDVLSVSSPNVPPLLQLIMDPYSSANRLFKIKAFDKE